MEGVGWVCEAAGHILVLTMLSALFGCAGIASVLSMLPKHTFVSCVCGVAKFTVCETASVLQAPSIFRLTNKLRVHMQLVNPTIVYVFQENKFNQLRNRNERNSNMVN